MQRSSYLVIRSLGHRVITRSEITPQDQDSTDQGGFSGKTRRLQAGARG